MAALNACAPGVWRMMACRWGLYVVFGLLAGVSFAAGYTDPDQYARLAGFRDAIAPRSPNWKAAVATWTCPTPPANSDSACDPCGRGTEGNWYHMHCRGKSQGWGESGDGTIDGIVTNSHITSSKVNGPVPKEECVLAHLRELDFGGLEGEGKLSGPVPTWLGKCFSELEELDLSDNRLTGTLPEYLAQMPLLTEVKFEYNALIGTIPEVFGLMPRQVRRFQVEYNYMHGTIPQTFSNSRNHLTEFLLAHNDFQGNLSAVAGGHLSIVSVHENPKLCGMVPATVRYAKGYNPAGTALGWPCASS